MTELITQIQIAVMIVIIFGTLGYFIAHHDSKPKIK